MSNARRTPVLFGVSALLVLGGTSAMAGTVAPAEQQPVAAVSPVDRSDALLRADRAYADRLARQALAERVAAERAAAARKAAVRAAQVKAAKAATARKAALRAAEARKAAERRAAAQRAARSAVRSIAPSGGSNRALGRAMAAERGWTGDQWTCLNNLWTKESGWRSTASGYSGAYGIPQALPGSKMKSAGADWRTNPATQIEWGLNYIDGRYGSPCGAWRHFQNRGWY